MTVFQFDEDDHPTLKSRTISGGSFAHFSVAENPSDSESDPDPETEELLEQVIQAESLPKADSEFIVPLEEPFVASLVENATVNRKVGPEDFEQLKVIGRGAYGKVLLVRQKATGRCFAMKVLKKASIIVHTKNTEYSKTERAILEEVSHPFIVKLFYAFQTNAKLYLILDYVAGGELFTHMAKERMFEEDVARFFTAELVLALEHLHSLGIIYRDLKPENCLLDNEGHIVLTDFGLSKVALNTNDGKTNTMCGTTQYMAPEVLLEVYYDKAVDWWSLGIMIYDMLTGAPPFKGSNRKKTMEAILNKKLRFPNYISPDAKDLMTRLLRKSPAVRLGSGPDGASAIKKHPFFRTIDWKALARREIKSPIIPLLSSADDVSNFDTQFTSLTVLESPASPSPISASFNRLFQGFSFVDRSTYLPYHE
ncbi:Pkinase-domain-containing protein [Basidiobolus meristosporus CBS 931.73]|uniref:non-specific serine/threonine protein kinase n=1 Tax=Basidiobolus meristosporus CBS 931.73 TaxID=1314790 RepID=A0A1Y1X831_9FUNG|nr:Pkinase-domain-containing protein [Basidiobolus meristosporus CBS 931.73]ORY06589.1 Pkinase-domain-containing protein [Basidiobolus meristosporus CBS 931.73]|eukprot:ORX81912.1 Pkinase-domain-containing protein [Basidiobolus meristosporus CBS 931.73]